MNKKVLVLCTGNSCRSQIMHGYLDHFYSDQLTVFSAGLETHGVNPRAIKVMEEDGVSIEHHTSNNVQDYLDEGIEYVITVCDHADENCPIFSGTVQRLHVGFPDPAKATGEELDILIQFRMVRDSIKDTVLSETITDFLHIHSEETTSEE